MSEFVNAKHVLTDEIVSIPVAWFETELADAYVIVDENGEPCLDCDQRAKTQATDEPPTDEPTADEAGFDADYDVPVTKKK